MLFVGVVVARTIDFEVVKRHGEINISRTGGILRTKCRSSLGLLGDEVPLSGRKCTSILGDNGLALLGASRSSVDSFQGCLRALNIRLDGGDGGSGECTTIGLGAAGLNHSLEEGGGSQLGERGEVDLGLGGLRHHGVSDIEGVDWGPRGDENESGDGETGDGVAHVSCLSVLSLDRFL